MATTTVTAIMPAADRPLRNHASALQSIRNSLTMAKRGLIRVRRNPSQLADVIIQPIVFTLMFTYLFGGAISGNIGAYLPLVIPGILAQTIITASVTTGVQLREDMDKGVFDRFKSLPIARIAPLAGALIADTVRYLIATVLTFGVGIAMGLRPESLLGVVGAGLLVIGFAWCLSWIFAFLGVIAKSAASVQGISFIFLFPLTFLSNAFVPTNTLPSWLQTFTKINPVSHLINAVRDLVNHGVIHTDFWLSIAGALVILAVFAPLTVRAYMHRA